MRIDYGPDNRFYYAFTTRCDSHDIGEIGSNMNIALLIIDMPIVFEEIKI